MLIAKILVFTVNFVLWASGILLIVFGGIALGSPSTIVSLLDLISGVSNITVLLNVGSLLEGMAIFMIVDGSLLFLFGGVGCHGILLKHRHTLMSYWLMLILGILTEIGVIIYGAVYPPTAQSWIQSQLNASLTSSFEPVTIINDTVSYYEQTSDAGAWEYLQDQTQCCGAYGYMDYQQFSWNLTGYPNATVPPSCCQSNLQQGQLVYSTSDYKNFNDCIAGAGSMYTQGCYNIAMEMLWNFEYIAMIIAGCLIATQIIGTVITVHTWHKMMREV